MPLRVMLLALLLAMAAPALAQDVVGLEDCSKAKGPDKKIGCMQSNVEFLHRLIKTGDTAATAAQAKLNAANVKISELQAELERLKAALAQLEKKLPASPPASPATPAPKQ
jgi:septal ring factor EnvC (AmiA/AmiB activator)